MRALPLLLVVLAQPAAARTILVEPGGAVSTLGAAMQAAQDGDTVRLGPGEFYECAVITQRNLVLQGAGDQTRLTDRTCESKALLVVRAEGVVVRDLVLARARVPDHNGAGIRLEAQGITIQQVRFDDDEMGVLAGLEGAGAVRVLDCVFAGGGVAGEHPTAALLVGGIDLLDVERSRFEGVKGNQVVSGARQSLLVGNSFVLGGEGGAGTAVLAEGSLSMRDNSLRIGPQAPPRDAAVLAEGDGATLQGNRMENTTGHALTLLLDWTHGTPVLDDNVIGPGDTLVSSSGLWRHWVGGTVREAYQDARHAAGAAVRGVAHVFGR